MSFIQVQTNVGRDGRKLAYVHFATSVWVTGRNRPAQKRVYLGKLDTASGEVAVSKGFPNRSGSRVPLATLQGKAKAGEDVEAWLRLPAEPDSLLAKGMDFPARVEVVGDAHLLLTLARETGLDAALEGAFGPKEGPAILALAMHQVAEGRPPYLAGHWLDERELPATMKGRIVSPEHVYGILLRTGADEAGRQRFFRDWFHRHRGVAAVICDTTSISTYAADLELAEFGHNRDGDRLPQINICLVADRQTGLPLWARPLPGSIPDVSTLERTVELLQDLGLEQFRFSLDRGFYSQSNLRELLAADLDFVIGAPFSTTRARALVRAHRAALATPKRSLQFHGHLMRHVCAAWSVPMADRSNREIDAHVFFEPERQAERVARVEKAVFAIEDKAAGETFASYAQAREWLRENAGGLARCLALRRDADGPVRIERRPRAVALAIARLGYTVVLSSRTGLEGAEVLEDYRSRDQVEKLFDSLKNEDGQYRLRTGIDESAEGRLFVAFAALVLRVALEDRLRHAGLLRRMTTAAALAQLRRIKAVTTLSGKRILLEIAKRHRILMAKLGLPLPT